MSRFRKSKWMLLLSVAAATSASFGVLLANAETMSVAEAVASFQMEGGAYVRATGQDKADNGLKYVVSMPKTAYEKVKETYADVTFGVLIAPEEWLTEGHELTAENVFGDEADYGFAKWNGSEWVYEGTKPQIVNLSTSVLETSEKDASRVEYGGAMVNIRDGVNDVTTNNLAREFRGVGYMSYTVGTEMQYVFVGNDENVRSMTYVAQRALESGAVSGDIATWVRQNYVDAVTDVATSYTVEHYLQKADGTYALKDKTTVSENVTIDDDAQATANEYSGYTYNAALGKSSGKTYANGRLALTFYYDREQATVTKDLGLVNVAETAALDLSEYASYLGENDLYLTATGEAAEATVSENALSLAGLNGAYTLRLASENGVAELTFDAYDATQGVEWNTVSAKTGAVTARAAGETLSATSVTVVDGENVPAGRTVNGSAFQINGASEAFAFNFLPLHTGAYYNEYAEKYCGWGMQMTFDYFVAAEQGENATTAIATTMVGFANTDTWTEINVGEWYSVTVPFSYMINGENLFETDGNFYQTYGGALRGDNACTAAEWYFANFVITYETVIAGETLADLNGASTVEEALLTEEQQQAFALFNTEGTLVWNIGGKTSFDVNELEGVYETKAVLTKDGKEISLYEGVVDFYNSADGMVWVPKNNLSTDDVYLKKTNAQVAIAAEIPAGLTGEEYFYITSDDLTENKNFLFSVYSHSKAYYEMWQAEAAKSGSSFKVTFDVYYETNAIIDYSAGYGATGYYSIFTWGGHETNNAGGSQLQMPAGTVNTITVTLNSFMANFDNFTNDSITSCGTFGNNFFGWKDLQENNVDVNATTGKIDIEFYIGNFRTTFVNGVSVRDYSSETKLEKTDGVSGEYDLTALLSEGDKTAIGDRLGELTWKMNGVAVPSKVDVETLDGLYEITLSESLLNAYDIVYYKAKIDFYKEADGMVWVPTNGLRVEDIYMKTGATVEIVNSGLPSGASASEYYHVYDDDTQGKFVFSLFRHSKAYYTMWQSKLAEINATASVSFELNHNVEVSAGAGYATFTIGNSNNQIFHGWKKFTITLSELVSNYNSYANMNNAYTWSSNIVGWSDEKSGDGLAVSMYIGNFQTNFITDVTVIDRTATTSLIDLDEYETFSPTDILSEDDLSALSAYSDLVWKANGVTVTDWTALDGVYTVTAVHEVMAYEVVYYKAKVDFYRTSDGLVWQPKSGLSLDDMICKTARMNKSIVTENLPTGATVSEYYYVTIEENTAKTYSYVLSITGIHSKAYYEMWQTKAAENNQTYTITFSFWHNSEKNVTGGSGTSQYNYIYVGGKNSHYYEGKWSTMQVTLDSLLTNWDTYLKANNANYSSGQNLMFLSDIDYAGDDIQMYIGNFQAVLNDVVAS